MTLGLFPSKGQVDSQAGQLAFMLMADFTRIQELKLWLDTQTDANLICWTIERAKIHSVSANCFQRMTTGNRVRDECLDNVPRKTRVPVRKAMALHVTGPTNHP